MPSSPPTPLERAARLASYAAGLALAAALLAAWQVPGAERDPRTEVSFEVNLTGELAVTPTGTIARAHDLTVGGGRLAARGRFRLRNQTPSALAIRPRVVPSTKTLDRLLLVTLRAGDRRLFRGPLGELRSGSERSLALGPGEEKTVRVRAWLRADDASTGGVHERIRLELPSEARR